LPVRSPAGQALGALSTVFDTDECPRAGEVLDQVELIAVPRLRLLADCHREDEKARASRPRPASSRKWRNVHPMWPSANAAAISSSRPAAPPPITTIQGEDGRWVSAPWNTNPCCWAPAFQGEPGFAKPRQLRGAWRRMRWWYPPIAASTEAPRKL